MIRVCLTPYEWKHAATVGITRHIACKGKRQTQLARNQRKGRCGVYLVDILGAMGEMAFAKAACLYWPGSVNVGKDEPDILPDFQVRTAREHRHNLIVRPDDLPHFRYALVPGTGPEFLVHGYISGADAKRPEFLQDKAGRGEPAFWVSHQPGRVYPQKAAGQHGRRSAGKENRRSPIV